MYAIGSKEQNGDPNALVVSAAPMALTTFVTRESLPSTLSERAVLSVSKVTVKPSAFTDTSATTTLFAYYRTDQHSRPTPNDDHVRRHTDHDGPEQNHAGITRRRAWSTPLILTPWFDE
jgi:hypothetical protein